jgi:hypothetical protein
MATTSPLEATAAQNAAAPLIDALTQMFHSSSKLNNGINTVDERVGKVEKDVLVVKKLVDDAEKNTLGIVSDMGADLSLVLDNVTILDTKLTGAITLLKSATDDMNKRLTQLSTDITNLMTKVVLKKK